MVTKQSKFSSMTNNIDTSDWTDESMSSPSAAFHCEAPQEPSWDHQPVC